MIALLVAAEQVRLEAIAEYESWRYIEDSDAREVARRQAEHRLNRHRASLALHMHSLEISTYPTLRDAALELVDAASARMLLNFVTAWNDSLVDKAIKLTAVAAEEFSPEKKTTP